MSRRSEVLERSERHDHHDPARRWNLVAVAIASLTGLGAAFLPLGTSRSIDSNGLQTTMRLTLLSEEGMGVLIILAIPVVLVALPLMLRGATAAHRARVATVVMLSVLVVLGAMSIGLFFVPTLIAMVVSIATRATTGTVTSSPSDQRPRTLG